MADIFYAHSLPGAVPERWQPLEEHLKNVAKMASEFAMPFKGEKWAYLAGLWHDLGEYSTDFQAKLLNENGIKTAVRPTGKIIHSDAGGHLACLKGWQSGAKRVLSWLIMGHHAGLADFHPDKIGVRSLSIRIKDPERSGDILKNVPQWLIDQPMPVQPIPKGASPSFFIRMLFSCLVDADFLDTEYFMDKTKSKLRRYDYPSLNYLCENFMKYMDRLMNKAKPTKVNALRREVFEYCIAKASEKKNVFSLTVPTGGGKTLASLAFALTHAITYRKDRIIYVIPYTNIIEQTASVFRRIPGFEKAVIEHHSNLIEDNSEIDSRLHLRLAAENWDAPLIVTTAVQFFESLYSCKSSRCRRLHNIINSIIIFDEAQCLPAEYLRPILYAIKELTKYYEVTPLFCTATQPVISRFKSVDFDFREAFHKEPIEIVRDPEELSQRIERVRFSLISKELMAINIEELAKYIDNESQSLLCIVNLKKDARAVASFLKTGKVFHLSTNMCPQHRQDVLYQIKEYLYRNQEMIRVISTSLVEAGVDLDFPVVYRAIAGLDSIIQAAGRCNREGKLDEHGRVIIFKLSKQPNYVSGRAEITEEFLRDGNNIENLQKHSAIKSYFKKWYWQLGSESLDKQNILKLLGGNRLDYYFRTASDRFRLIEDRHTVGVLAPYGNVMEILARLQKEPWNHREIKRRLQRYSINIFIDQMDKLIKNHLIHPVGQSQQEINLFMVDESIYHKDFGLVPSEDAMPVDPEDFIL